MRDREYLAIDALTCAKAEGTITKEDIEKVLAPFTPEIKLLVTDDDEVWAITGWVYVIDRDTGEGMMLMKIGHSASYLTEPAGL